MATIAQPDRLTMVDSQCSESDFGPNFADSVNLGLNRAGGKTLPCKFFYDETGSEIFEQITELEEYYPTKCERQILEDHSAQIASICRGNTVIVELGSGSSSKTRTLLNAFVQQFGDTLYIPIDISAEFLKQSSIDLLKQFKEHLKITAIPGLYQQGLKYLKDSNEFSSAKKLICFFGSSLGNFTKTEAIQFLKEIGDCMGRHDKFLLGIDLKKDVNILRAAYNDSKGVTAAFNLNLLARINKELGGEFDLSSFRHDAVWNETEGKIEMRLYSNKAQTVPIKSLGINVSFQENEFIHTENCHKYSLADIKELAQSSGFRIEQRWLDNTERFCLSLLTKSKDPLNPIE